MSETTEDIYIQRGGMVRIGDDGECVTLAIHGGMAVPVLHLSADEAGYVASNLMTLSERVIAGTQGRVKELEAHLRDLLARIDEIVMESEATSETVPCFLRCSVNAAREAAEQVREKT